MQHAAPLSLAERIEAIEQAYELMLAYAAQGRQNDTDDSSSIRRFLQRADAALDGLAACLRAERGGRADDMPTSSRCSKQDARATRAALRLVLAQPALSSQLIDNLNASIHIRALLTDIFLIDETLKSARRWLTRHRLRLGVIGLGAMGARIATRLVWQGFNPQVYDVVDIAVRMFTNDVGGMMSGSPKMMAQSCDVDHHGAAVGRCIARRAVRLGGTGWRVQRRAARSSTWALPIRWRPSIWRSSLRNGASI